MKIVHSIIIPFHNRKDFMDRAIDSVLSQRNLILSSDERIELILVDDGSDDGWKLSMYKNIPEYIYIRNYKTDNQGVSQARNFGVNESRGKWIHFLDSDDEWKPNKLARQDQYHKENSNIRISQTEEVWIRDGKFVNPMKKHKKVEEGLFEKSLDQCMITPSSFCIEKDLWNFFGGMDERLPACEDYDLWLGISAKERVGLIPEKLLIRYAGHEDQLSNRYPVMDRFRIYSLIKRRNDFNLNQKILAKKITINKLEILIIGRGKRKKDTKVLEDILDWVKISYCEENVDIDLHSINFLLNTNIWVS